MSTEEIRLCHIDDIADGGSKGLRPFDERNDSLFVVRQGDQVVAYRNRCPHQQARMAWRKDAYLNRAGTRIVCFAHGAQFDIDSGVCTAGAALGKRLEDIPIRVADDGDIFAAADELMKLKEQ